MPHSSSEGKAWLVHRIWGALADAPRRHGNGGTGDVFTPRLLDVGAGSGTYADLLGPFERGVFGHPHLTAVEIHAPYVERFQLRRKYDEVIVGDAREIEFPESDVVVLGDVLEHVRFGEAKQLWAKAREAATTAVFLSLPIVEWPQDAMDGNEHEAHLHTWSHASVLANLPGIVDFEVGASIGVYRARPERQS